MLRKMCLGALLLAAATAGPAGAVEAEDVIRVRGFISQGYLNTSDNEYLVARSRDGTAEMTEAAVTIVAEPADRLRVGAQFLARNFGDQGDDRVILDWGYLDYRWRDELGVRAGKVKLPWGLYNEERDLDFLRTHVFLPQSVYSEELRDFLMAYEGVGAYGSLAADGWGQFDYHAYGGTLNVAEPDRGFWKSNFERQAEDLEPLVAEAVEQERGLAPGEAEAEFVNAIDPAVTFPYVWGGSLVWTTPLEGLRLGSSFLGGRFRYESRFRYDVAIDGPAGPDHTAYTLDVDASWDMNRLVTYSAEYTWRDLLLAAEYYDEKIELDQPTGWYAGADWRATARVSLGAYYASYWRSRHDKEGAEMEALGLPRHYGWQKSAVVALRYDLGDFWLVKLEYHVIDGVAQARMNSIRDEQLAPAERHWGMFTARTTVHF